MMMERALDVMFERWRPQSTGRILVLHCLPWKITTSSRVVLELQDVKYAVWHPQSKGSTITLRNSTQNMILAVALKMTGSTPDLQYLLWQFTTSSRVALACSLADATVLSTT